MTIHISIPDHFEDVCGVKRTDSEWSAEALREDVVLPLLKNRKENEKVIICLDNKEIDFFGYGSSFLKEAFIGLVSYGDYSYYDFKDNFSFTAVDSHFDFYIKKIEQYIEEYRVNELENS